MGVVFQVVATYAPYIYLACGLVALYQLYRLWQVRGERRQAVFSLEREKAVRDLSGIFSVAVILLAVVLMIIWGLTRLVDMGVKPYAIATSVSLIIAQRLARRLCNNCKAPAKIPAEALKKEGFGDEEIANGLQIFQPVGCSNCTDGYKGRTGLYEVMPVSDEIGRIIMAGGSVLDIKQQATREGVWGLRQAGINKVRMGITSLDEVNRVTVD